MALNARPQGSFKLACMVNGPIETNTYFVISQNECLVIDPAWDGKKLVDHLAAEYPQARIVGMACTHGHADHVGGAAGIRRSLGEGVPFMLPAADEDCARTNIAWQRDNFGFDTPAPPAADRLLREGDTVAVGNVSLQVIETPGHTPGGVVYFTATEQGNFAFVGDTLFPGSHGRTDLEGASEVAMQQSLIKLARLLPADTTCLIGHGPSTTMERELMMNPFMQGAL